MARRPSLRLDEDEIWSFLEQGHTGILTTLRRDGMPIALPVWYVVDERAIYVSGPARTAKWKRLAHDSRASFLVEKGLAWRDLEAVQLNGRAVFVDDPALLARIAELSDAKYAAFRTARPAMPERARAHYDAGIRTVRIEPEGRILSWRNAKLPIAE